MSQVPPDHSPGPVSDESPRQSRTALGDSPQAPGPYVQVPVELLTRTDLAPDELARWALLQRRVRPGRPDVEGMTRGLLAAAHGRADGDLDAESRLTARMVGHGVLHVEQRRYRHRTLNLYRPLGAVEQGDGRRYVELPCAALDALAAGQVSATVLRTLLLLLLACGRDGWTDTALTAIARDAHLTTRTLRAHRGQLVAVGLLEVDQQPGKAARTARPGRLPEAPSPRLTPEDRSSTTPEDRSSTTPEDRSGPSTYLETRTSGTPTRRALTSRRDLTSGTARDRTAPPARAQAGRQANPDRRRPQHREAGQVAAAVPWLRQAPGHFRRAALRLVDDALTAGYGSAALARALQRTDPERDHVPAVRAALTELRADVLAGACPACGLDDQDLPEVCDRCHPDVDALDPAALAALARWADAAAPPAPPGDAATSAAA